jgi:uncharacterized protein YcbK (DUF882 family)
MSTYNLNTRLAPNFTLSEVVNWPNHQNMKNIDRVLAIRLATDALNPTIVSNAVNIAAELQSLRDWVNQQFPKYQGRIGVRVTSWLRPLAWEQHRRRSGTSQHLNGHAVDFISVNVYAADYNVIMDAIFRRYANWNGGLARAMQGNRFSFIHLDLGRKRRWTY